MSIRWFTLIKKQVEPRVKHYLGFPSELTAGADERITLPRPRVLIIEKNSSGVFLYRFSPDGQCVGDTWHVNLNEARHQATFEYGVLLTEWKQVPADIDDPIPFALKQG
jgi:hypothetical protein